MTTWAEQLAQIQDRQREVVADRRARVLKYPDLAQRLTDRPLSFTRPELWNGFVPPKTVPAEDGYVINTSPYRAALVAICAEAMQRDQDGGEQAVLDTEIQGEQCDCGAYRDPDGICRSCETWTASS